jgi:hypothetical protein
MSVLLRMFRTVFVILLAINLFGCVSVHKHTEPASSLGGAEGNKEPEIILARVNGSEVTVEDYKLQLQELNPQMRQTVTKDAKASREYLDDLINIELVLQEARRQGLDSDDEFKKQSVQMTRGQVRNLLFNALLKKELGIKMAAITEPTSEELLNYYNKNIDKMQAPDGKHLDFKEFEPKLKIRLKQEKRRELYLEYAGGLKSKATITVYETALEAAATQIRTQQAKDASNRRDIIELLEITKSYNIAMQAMSQFMNSYKETFNRNRPNEKKVPDEVVAKIIEEIKSELDKESFYDMIVPVYEKYLSNKDIKEIMAFYKSRAGRKFISVLPDILKDNGAAAQKWAKKAMERIGPKIEQRLKEMGYPKANVG